MGAEPEGRILCVVGARPNFIKIAPVVMALRARPGLAVRLVHTGQHYDDAMSAVFFEELGIPAPDVGLGIGPGSHAAQIAAVMRGVEPVIDAWAPSLLLIVGDVNSTLAAALVAVTRGLPIAHVEAGLRSFDRTMPEEINRVLTDQISELLFTTERGAEANLRREGIAPERVHFVGNVMIDSLRAGLARAVPADAILAGADEAAAARARREGFALATLHRPANVDDPAALARLLGALTRIAERLPVVFPVHPRTAGRIAAAGLEPALARADVLRLPPLGYLRMLGLMRAARLVLTDSGGIQEETTGLGVPCLTLRPNTERPITVEQGTNTVVGTDPEAIVRAADEILRTGGKRGRIPELWDGRAAERIAERIVAWLAARP